PALGLRPALDHLRPAVPEGAGQAQHPRRQRGAVVRTGYEGGEDDSVGRTPNSGSPHGEAECGLAVPDCASLHRGYLLSSYNSTCHKCLTTAVFSMPQCET